jgi:hypothetical protein
MTANDLNLRRSDTDMQTAVDAWCNSDDDTAKRGAVIAKYGEISQWDMKHVTTCRELFQDKRDFNDDITEWDMSNVKDMSDMFNTATSFNQSIGKWNVSSATSMAYMFWSANAFKQQSIENWDLSSVKDVYNMFDLPSAYHISKEGREIHGGKPPRAK